MGRTHLIIPISKRQAFEDLWNNPLIERFDYWKTYLEVSIKFFQKHYEQLGEDIREFNKEHIDKPVINPFTGSYETYDGIEVHLDAVNNSEKAEAKVYPLVLIGVYTDFESTLKAICKSFGDFKSDITKFKGQYIDNCKVYIEDVIGYSFCNELCEFWTQIDRFRELRNTFAHNDNPVPNQKEDRLLKLTNIDEENIEITDDRFVIIKNDTPIVHFIDICEKCINNIIEQIASKIEE